MKPEEFKAITDQILQQHTDQAVVSTLLSKLVEDYNSEAAEKTNALSTAEKLTSDNEVLRKANMDLFLKIGVSDTQKPPNVQTKDETPKFEDLFDENGNLK